jgi:hypothetical protein
MPNSSHKLSQRGRDHAVTKAIDTYHGGVN